MSWLGETDIDKSFAHWFPRSLNIRMSSKEGAGLCQECAFQHMRSVFRCQSILTCDISIIVSPFLSLFLDAGVYGS